LQIRSADWDQLVAAYGSPIPHAARVEIVAHTNKFLEFAVFESAAEPVSDAISRVKWAAPQLRCWKCCAGARAAMLTSPQIGTIEKHLRQQTPINP
jgi:hypothetical protein